ncbi:alcohol dehydrogenase catalytic domain-containing protein [Streptomyces yokosukanensis]|nr:alcohol dehydrogenase catalytic domain-containing protein [Streptomyces yokosukanensis]
MFGAGDVQVKEVPDARIAQQTDAVVRVTHAAICGSDLWRYQKLQPTPDGVRVGHEFIGVVEEVGAQVTSVRRGDLVLAPFKWSDGTCEFCRAGLHSSCLNGGFWGGELDGGQGEAVRVPQADGTLVPLPLEPADPRLPAVLALSDVLCTGHHAARAAGVGPGATVVVVGDGAVGLCAVLASARLGAERIVILGRHARRTDLARRYGAVEVVPERGADAVERVRALTGGHGAHAVLECVGTGAALRDALDMARPGGAVGYVGVPQDGEGVDVRRFYRRNVTLAGGVTPARAYVPVLLPDVLSGRLDASAVFDRTVEVDGIPDGYKAMAEREALKVLIRP